MLIVCSDALAKKLLCITEAVFSVLLLGYRLKDLEWILMAIRKRKRLV